MPRQSRIDGAGALHHIIAGGTHGKTIFDDDFDQKRMLIFYLNFARNSL